MSSDRDNLDRHVERIIVALQRHRVLDRADKHGKGLDLGAKRAALTSLLTEVLHEYSVVREDWETRHDPNKPKKQLEANFDRGEEAPHDYGPDAGAGLPPWEEHYKRFYATGPGNPGRSRDGSALLPITPLHTVYRIVRNWWLAEVGPRFNPDFSHEHEGDQRRNPDRFNSAARLFWMIADFIDHRYTAPICYGVHETVRKQLQKEARSAKGQPRKHE